MLNSICPGCRTGDRRIERDTEGYRSGHNGAVLKTVRGKLHAGSNPAPSAKAKILSTNVGGIFALYYSFFSFRYSLFISPTKFTK